MEKEIDYRKRISTITLTVTIVVAVLLTSVMLTYANQKTIIENTEEILNESVEAVSATQTVKYNVDTEGRTPEIIHYLESMEDFQGTVFVIDPFHGGVSSGIKAGDLFEKNVILKVALKVKELSMEKPYEVLLIRNNDYYLSTQDRINLATMIEADYYIGIHLDADVEDAKQFGMKGYYNPEYYFDAVENSQVADTLLRNVVETTKNRAIGLFEAGEDEVILKALDIPGAIISCGYLSNADEANLLADNDYLDKVAAGIVASLDELDKEGK